MITVYIFSKRTASIQLKEINPDELGNQKNMKITLSCLVLISSVAAFGQTTDMSLCHDKLLNNKGDSAAHRITTTEFDAGPNEMLDEKSSINAVLKVMKNNGCQTENLKLRSSCSEIIKGSRYTACLVQDPQLYGFFTLVKDYVDTFHLIYSRWD